MSVTVGHRTRAVTNQVNMGTASAGVLFSTEVHFRKSTWTPHVRPHHPITGSGPDSLVPGELLAGKQLWA